MKKKELVKTLMERMQKFGYFPSFTNVKTFIKEYEKLANPEPQKPVVPQFVADVIEGARGHSAELEDALHYTWFNGSEEFTEWYKKKSNRDLFARAWLDGYTVEKEKRYLVKMKAFEVGFNFLNRHKRENCWIFSTKDETITYQPYHTRKELEDAGLGWVFDCEGVEIEEVTE